MPGPLDYAIVYHGDNCRDGYTGLWAARRALIGPAAGCALATTTPERIGAWPSVYGKPLPDDLLAALRSGPTHLLLIDFCYGPKELARLLPLAATTTVIDHHASAEATIRATGRVARPGTFTAHFDKAHSGARLAWDYLAGRAARPGPRPALIDYVEDRDLWRWKLPYSHEVNAVLESHALSLEAWDELAHLLDAPGEPAVGGRLVTEGQAILRFKERLVEQMAETAVAGKFGGHEVLAANASVLRSEVAGKLAAGRPFGIVWYIRSDGKLIVSLRTRTEGGEPTLDMSKLAARYGGGGHPAAAGCEVVLSGHPLFDAAAVLGRDGR